MEKRISLKIGTSKDGKTCEKCPYTSTMEAGCFIFGALKETKDGKFTRSPKCRGREVQ